MKSDRRAALLAAIAGSAEKELPVGKIAQSFRKQALYRQARQIFITPSPLLTQVGMNALADGKKLVMPAPGLREGFFLFEPYSVPFAKMSLAVSLRGLPEYGTRLSPAGMQDLQIELLVTDALAVDREGTLLGDGKGYFDLAAALLREMNGLSGTAAAVVIPRQLAVLEELLPRDPWDVAADLVLGLGGAIGLDSAGRQSCRKASVHWDRLELDRIKRINPLWYLYKQRKKD